MLVCILSRWRCNGCFRFSQGFMYAFGWYVCSMVSTINWDLVFFTQSRVNMLNKTWQINSVLKEEYSLILRKPGHRCQIKLIHSVGISWWSSKCDLIQNSILLCPNHNNWALRFCCYITQFQLISYEEHGLYVVCCFNLHMICQFWTDWVSLASWMEWWKQIRSLWYVYASIKPSEMRGAESLWCLGDKKGLGGKCIMEINYVSTRERAKNYMPWYKFHWCNFKDFFPSSFE